MNNNNNRKKHSWVKFIPLLGLALGFIAMFYLGVHEHLTLQSLKTHRIDLLHFTAEHPIAFATIFILIYTTAVAFTMPNATLLTITAGFLFGPIAGTSYVVIAATLGACIIFLATKFAFQDLFREKAGQWLMKMSDGFQSNAISYMLFLRLVPLFPFWLINIVPAFFGVRLVTFMLTTFIGIIPGTFVYIMLGHGLGAILEQGESINLGIIFTPSIITPLVGLAILALVPIIYKKLFKKE